MVKKNDRVCVDGRKVGQARRYGTVRAVNQALLTVQWDDGTTSTFVPTAGSLTVVGQAPPPR
jgi:Domain of unknown function (DUF1918)